MPLTSILIRVSSLSSALVLTTFASAGIQFYGDQDVMGTGTYSSDPIAGATLEGLFPGSVTYATLIQSHTYPFGPEADDFAGTDQMYVAQDQTSFWDGYSQHPSRKKGPQILTLDYASLVPVGHKVTSLTLGIAADDFQRLIVGQAFEARINGTVIAPLTNALNSLDQTGPRVQFLTVGVDTALLTNTNSLQLSINNLGDGRDGWAVDFLSIGVTTESVQAVPEPTTVAVLGLGTASLVRFRRRRAVR